MTECNNTDMRDLLPDFVAGQLSAAEQAVAESHVESCAECTDEVALLRLALSVRPRAVSVDVARIVAALPARHALAIPAAGADGRLARATGQVSGMTRGFTGPRLVREVPAAAKRSSPVRSSTWRMAAAIGIAAIGGWSVLTLRSDDNAAATGAAIAAVPAGEGEAGAMRAGETLAVSSTSGLGTRTVDSNDARSLDREAPGSSLGNLSEYSDADLQSMLDRLEKWDGATSADPLPTVPIVSVTPRGTL